MYITPPGIRTPYIHVVRTLFPIPRMSRLERFTVQVTSQFSRLGTQLSVLFFVYLYFTGVVCWVWCVGSRFPSFLYDYLRYMCVHVHVHVHVLCATHMSCISRTCTCTCTCTSYVVQCVFCLALAQTHTLAEVIAGTLS